MSVATVLLRLRGKDSSESYKTPRMLSFRVADKSDPLNALFVQFPAPLKNFVETMTFLARYHFPGKRIGQLKTVHGLRPRQVANLNADGSLNCFTPFPREFSTFLASPYELPTNLYRGHSVEEFFVDIAQSEKFSTLYHRCNVVFAPIDYDSELLSGAGILPYFQVGGEEFTSLKVGKTVSMLRNLFRIVDIFHDINDKRVIVIKRIETQPASAG